MLERTACRFWQVVLQSGLADAQALQSWWDAIPEEKRTHEHIDRRLAKQAVQTGALTIWQAQQLLAGRSTGFRIDRYILLELIGQGGMGRVYLARDSKLNRRVALKILSPERVNNPRAIARFHREAMVGAQLQHENLVRIYDEGEAGGKCYLVMEYIEGKNIGQMISEGGPLPPAIAAKLTRQVALGLEHAQRKGLIHRDVNPYNILVTHDGTAKLTDMGLAIDLGDADHVTRDGATVGTFDYVSPEQARHSHSVDTRSDIYSLGCSLYHMLTGQVPFPTSSLPEKLFSHQATVPESVRTHAPWVPEGLAEVVARTLLKTAEERYTTPLELAQALEPYAEDTAGTSNEPVSNARSSPSVRVGSEATVTRQFAATVPPTPAAPVAPAEALDLGIDLGAGAGVGPSGSSASATGTSSIVPADSVALGINLEVTANSAPALPPTPKKAPPAPTPSATKMSDENPLDFGINLGGESKAAEPVGLGINFDAPAPPAAPAAAPKPKPAPPPAPKKAPPAPVPTPSVAKVSDEKPLDFGINLGGESKAAESVGLGINFDAPAPPPAAPAAAPKPKPTPPPAPKKAPPSPAPTPSVAKVSDENPLDFGISLGGESKATEPVGLGINFDAPAPPPAAPAAAPKPKPAPPPAPKKAPPASAPTPSVAKVSDETPLDFGISIGGASEPAEPIGLGIDLDVPPPKIAAAPEPKPAPRPVVAPPPAPAPAPSVPATPATPPLVFDAPADAAPGGFGLGVNLGPEPPLTRTPPSKPKPKVEKKKEDEKPTPTATEPAVEAKSAPAGAGRPKWLIPAAAAGLVALLAGGGLAYRQFSGSGTSKAASTEKAANKPKTKPKEATVEKEKAVAVAAVTPTVPAKPAPPPPSGEILSVARDGTMTVQPNLKDAIRAAIGSKGHVLLRNKSPLVLKAGDTLRGAGGMLVIQAGAGIKPVLKVEVKGGTPFLATRTDAPLKIEGITIEATYVEPGNDPAPIIEAGGAVTLDRCAFRLTTSVAKSRALAIEGESIQADGCWFENFDRALDVACFSGSKATLRHCMIVKTSPADQVPGIAALRLRNMPGGFNKTGRKLTLDHCTVRNGGFLDFAGFAPDAPITAEIAATAVSSDYLLTWEPGTTADPRTKDAGAFNPAALKWSGRDNQYDVHSVDGWVRLIATRGAAATPLPDGPKDLNAWSQRLAETDTAPPPIKFATDPASLSQSASPSDFAIADSGVRSRGADPKFVGPGAKPLPKAR